jgi:hypothetical protein
MITSGFGLFSVTVVSGVIRISLRASMSAPVFRRVIITSGLRIIPSDLHQSCFAILTLGVDVRICPENSALHVGFALWRVVVRPSRFFLT